MLKHPARMKENEKHAVLSDAQEDHKMMRNRVCGTSSTEQWEVGMTNQQMLLAISVPWSFLVAPALL